MLFYLQTLLGVLAPLLFLGWSDWQEPEVLPPPAPAGPSWAALRRRAAHAASAANWGVWRCATLPRSLPPLLAAWLLLSLTWTVTLVAFQL